jgi:hypothetical protein
VIRHRRALAVALVLVALLAGCSGDDGEDGDDAGPSTTTETGSDDGGSSDDDGSGSDDGSGDAGEDGTRDEGRADGEGAAGTGPAVPSSGCDTAPHAPVGPSGSTRPPMGSSATTC